MPSAFTLFGELRADTSAFDRSLAAADARLVKTRQELEKTEGASKAIGDTSATVARRYEKLNEQIGFQRSRLTEVAAAYNNGHVGAQKFAQVLASVDTQTRSLNSRLADAKARVDELNGTGLTHFQNQIKGAVEHSLIDLNSARPLQGLGPVLQGLGARKYGLDETILNILIVAARQAGILKVAQEGTAVAAAATAAAETECAVAATTAAAAETEFTVAAQAGAVAQTEVAAASAATATSAASTLASVTLFGAGLIPIAAVTGAILATFFGMKKVGEDIRAIGEDRLKNEEAIAGALNAQYLAAKQLKDELANITLNADFAEFIKNAGTGPTGTDFLKNAQAKLQQQYDANQKSVTDELTRRNAAADSLGLTGGSRSDYVNKATPAGFNEAQKALADQIKELANAIVGLKPSVQDYKNKYPYGVAAQFGQDTANFGTNSPKYQEAQQKALEAAKKKAEEFKKSLEDARKYVLENFATLSGSDNPFVKIFSEGQRAIEQMLVATKAIGPALQRQFTAQINLRTQNATFQQDLNNRVKAYDLRSDARQFRAGKLDDNSPENFQKNLQDKLDAIGFKSVRGIVGYAAGGVGIDSSGYDNGHATSGAFAPIFGNIKIPLGDNKEQRAIAERAIIAATQGIDPSKLSKDQQKLAATAREHEAERLENEKKEASETQKKLVEVLNKIAKQESLVRIVNEAPDKAKVETRPTAATTADAYPGVD
jgi:hypothetical protein